MGGGGGGGGSNRGHHLKEDQWSIGGAICTHPRPLSISDILNCMSTDESIAAIYKRLSDYCQLDRSIPQWGDAPVWNELHMSTDFPTYWD